MSTPRSRGLACQAGGRQDRRRRYRHARSSAGPATGRRRVSCVLYLLSQGVLIAEHVTGLAPLSGRCTEIMFLGLNIAGSDGAPARATARAID